MPTDTVGQFDVLADGTLVASRGGNPLTRIVFGAGFPDLDEVVNLLANRLD